MKKKLKQIAILAFAVILILQPVSVVQASTKSDAAKVLKYYKAGKIKKAKQYNKKLPKTQSKACIKKLSKKTKAAYRKTVKKYRLNYKAGEDYIWGYYLSDLDGDKKAELFVQYGSCEADARTDIYKYQGGKVKKVDTLYSGHTSYYEYPGHAGVICVWGHMGYESVSVMAIKNGEVKTTGYGSREVGYTGSWFPFRQALDNHKSYNSNFKAVLDLKDLK